MRECFYSNCPVPQAFNLAVTRFEDALAARGVHFNLLPSENSATHFAADMDAYFRFGGEIPPLITIGLRAPGSTRLLGLTRLRGMQGYFVRADSDIRTPADLKGRKIGLARNAFALIDGFDQDAYLAMNPWDQTMVGLGMWEVRALESTLAMGGLSMDDITRVQVKTPWSISLAEAEAAKTHSPKDLFRDTSSAAGNPQVKALLDGDVDAIYSFLAYSGELAARGEARLLADISPQAGPRPSDDYMSTFTVSASLVEDEPEVVQAVVDVTLMAGRWAKENPEAAVAATGENLAVEPDTIWRTYGAEFNRTLVPSLSADALAVLDRTQSYLVARGALPKAVDLAAWSAPQFLERALRMAA